MNIWILTIGSSDVQFTADDDEWNRLYRKVRNQINTSHKFSPTPRPNDDTGEAFLVPARVMGMVYEEQLAENYGDLYFPLLDAFSQKLQGENTPNRIIVILTDQEQVFTAQERKERNCPYWQDTCKLKPIIERYLKNNFPNATIEEPIYLKPQSKEEGLDNWDKALGLVTKELSQKEADANDKIYVSHQASTPAISSAVQFMSLARFGERVKFLVSNEYEKKPLEPIKSEEYLRGIKFQEAKALLERHDYSGVKELLEFYLEPEAKILLEAAIQWNFAEFEEFAEKLLQYPDEKFVKEVQERIKEDNWWWMAYEAAYLAVVRLNQENTVESMFHSFRALEGLTIKYAKKNRRFLFGRNVFDYLKRQKSQEWVSHPYIKELVRSEIQDRATRNDILDQRNNLFHQVEGFKEQDLYEAWKATDKTNWQDRVLQCLNFIAEESFTPPLEEASLMFKVHQELKNAITQSVAH